MVEGVVMDIEEQKEARRKAARDYRELARKNHICTSCFKEVAAIGFNQCPKCLEKGTLYRAKRLQRPEVREAYNERSRAVYNQRKEQHLCTKCGKKLTTEHTLCERCLAKERARSKRNYAKHGKLSRKPAKLKLEETRERTLAQGLIPCKYCGEPVVEGKKLCEKHYKKCLDALALGKEKSTYRHQVVMYKALVAKVAGREFNYET